MKDYQEIKDWVNDALKDEVGIQSLNCIYDRAMTHVVTLAIQKFSPPPCEFSWFVLGSGGRRELVSKSDQDHGIIFEQEGHHEYFQKLGKEISSGLYTLGFAYCDGKVMASERTWCRSVGEWQQQIALWKQSEDLIDIRHLQMMLDCRIVYGSELLGEQLKQSLFPLEHHLVELLATNMSLIKKGLTPLGQLIVDQWQRFDYKNCIYVPYVNSQRLAKLQNRPIDRELHAEIMQYRLLEQPMIVVTPQNKKSLKELTKAVKKLHLEVLTQIGIRC